MHEKGDEKDKTFKVSTVIAVVIITIIIVFGIYFFSQKQETKDNLTERELGPRENYKYAFIDKDESKIYIKLDKNINHSNVENVEFIFADYTNYNYTFINTSYKIIDEKAYDFVILKEELGIVNFSIITDLFVEIKYKETINITNVTENKPPLTNKTGSTSGGSSGGGSSGGGSTTPCIARMCSYYVGQCGETMDNGCGGTINCSDNCAADEICINETCKSSFECTQDSNCTFLNLNEISTCTNNPDNNEYTFDFAAENISICNLTTNTCEIVTQQLIHSCNISCGAECLTNTDCSCPEDYCNDSDSDSIEDDYIDYPNNGSCSDCQCHNETTNLCSPNIFIDDLRCNPAICGNNISEIGEICDNESLNGETCITNNYLSGNLECCEDCLGFDYSGCENETCSSCSDSDSGIDYYAAGSVLAEKTTEYGPDCSGGRPSNLTDPNNYQDSCAGNVLTEYSCLNNCLQETYYDCSSEGKICQNNACTDIVFNDGCIQIVDANTQYSLTNNIYYDVNSACIQVRADNVTIDCQNYFIDGEGTTEAAGIYSDGENTLIKNCQIRNMQNGGEAIYLEQAHNSSVTNSTFDNSQYGITIKDSQGVYFSGNTISNSNIVGIGIEGSTLNLTISYNNLINNSAFGIIVSSNILNTRITNNYFSENINGIYNYGRNTTILKNKFYNSSQYALYMGNPSTKTEITSNEIKNVHDGISLSRVNNTKVENNNISSCTGFGVQLLMTQDVTVRKNNFSSNNRGVHLHISGKNDLIELNAIEKSQYGIWISISNNSAVYQNNITSGNIGIFLQEYSKNINLTRNKITNNTEGIYVVRNNTDINLQDNIICSNTRDAFCQADAINLDNNLCLTNDGCSGTCSSCAAGSLNPSAVFWRFVKRFLSGP